MEKPDHNPFQSGVGFIYHWKKNHPGYDWPGCGHKFGLCGHDPVPVAVVCKNRINQYMHAVVIILYCTSVVLVSPEKGVGVSY